MATSADQMLHLEAQLSARRTEADNKRSRRLRWQEALTSLWSPVTIFGIAFALYLILIETSVCTYLWAQGLLKLFGLAMLGYFGGLLVYRFAIPKAGALRRLRREAREQLHEVDQLLRKSEGKLDPKLKERVIEQSAVVDAHWLTGDAGKLEPELAKLSELADKHLAAWRARSGLDLAGGFVKALLIALAIRAVIIEPYRIPSGSMIPTLEVGDQIFVNKFIYGVRIPWVNVVPFQIVRAPKRGDVIVFNNPVQPELDYIKRVVGVPGDEVRIIDKNVVINGKRVPVAVENERYVHADHRPGFGWTQNEATLFREVLDGQPHLALRSSNEGPSEGPFVVPPEHVFVMGDNRDNSEDSRYGLGNRALGPQYVPFGNIKGKAMVIWLSWSYGGLLSGVFGGSGLRTDRLFLPVTMCGAEPPRSPSPAQP